MASSFDPIASDYSELVSRSIAFGPREHDFYVRRKADALIDVTRRLLGEPAEQAVLDVGCGIGLTDEHLRGRFGTLHGVDTAHEAVALAAKRNPDVGYQVYDGSRLPYEEGRFDLAFAICVLHHVPVGDWVPFARELARVVRPGGLVVVVEHNPRNPLTRVAVSRCPFDEDAVLLGRRRACRVLAAAGLDPVEARFILLVPVDQPWTTRVERATARLPLGAQHYVAARRPH
jgi:SAM-dependent methyltransferase